MRDAAEAAGFAVEPRRGRDAETAFIATYGGVGAPAIALLGEFDARCPALAMQRGATAHRPIVPNGPGHGCGHNLLGTVRPRRGRDGRAPRDPPRRGHRHGPFLELAAPPRRRWSGRSLW